MRPRPGEIARRALADEQRLAKIEDWFRTKAGARGYSTKVLDEVWSVVSSFGAYGFCRAHAVAFAVPALQSAWLKAHHPAALYAGLLEHDPGMWPPCVIVSDARRHNVPVLPVDINHSKPAYTVEKTPTGWGVRISLATVRASQKTRSPGSPPASPTPPSKTSTPAPTPSSPSSSVSSRSAPSTG
ncbi:hypothetical protein [Streptomyces agglomeratus]|uniref:hypothetical protein n=1 Tax=Streptomyces agglomeratus TaxID=285458 RepID=UPI000A7C6CB0